MTTNPLWFVLAGFLLGFATSTLWEWFHFRKARMRALEQRTRGADSGSRSLSAGEPAGVARPVVEESSWSGQAYRSPGVFLESEGSKAGSPPRREPGPVAEYSDEAEQLDEPFTPPTVAMVAGQRPAGGLTPRRRQEVLAALRRSSDVAATKSEPAASSRAAPSPATTEQRPARSDEPILAPPDPGRAWRNDASLTRPSKDHPDNLSKIKGIGDVYRQRLFHAGIYTWRQIAESDLEALRQATGAYPSSNVEEWPVQARALMAKHGREQAVYDGPPPDELTKILGIGPVSAQTLYYAGICTYEQLASATVPDLAALFPVAVAGDQPDFAAWIVQAARLADQKHRS